MLISAIKSNGAEKDEEGREGSELSRKLSIGMKSKGKSGPGAGKASAEVRSPRGHWGTSARSTRKSALQRSLGQDFTVSRQKRVSNRCAPEGEKEAVRP